MVPPVPWFVHSDDQLVLSNCILRDMLGIIAPMERSRQRKPWLSQRSMSLVAVRSASRRAFASQERERRAQLARVVFRAWRAEYAEQRTPEDASTARESLRLLRVSAAVAYHWLVEARTMATKSIQADRVAHLTNVATEAAQAHYAGGVTRLYAIQRSLTAKKPHPWQHINDSGGKVITSHAVARHRWFSYVEPLFLCELAVIC